MFGSIAAVALAAAGVASAQNYSTASNYNASAYPSFSGNMFQKYNLSANGIMASFIPYGARTTNLYVKDSSGNYQDVVVGYDQGEQYLNDTETVHTYFGAVVGRYANRIKNGTFTVPGQGTYQIPENEFDGETTLHGGFIGYDQQNWTVVSVTGNSITFSFYDNAQSNFPGDVYNIATYTLTDEPALISRLVSFAINEATPIMLANHIYWNLGAFQTQEAELVLNNTLWMPYADRHIDTDGILVPTGQISLTNGTALDFTQSGTTIGQNIQNNSCGTGCTGYDNAFILDRPRNALESQDLEVLQLYSPVTGIQMSVETNQQGLQIYSCNGEDGTIPVKSSQQVGNSTSYVQKYGCLVIETQDWIAGINYPEWGRDQYQIFSPTSEPAINYQKYTFSVV